MLDIKDISYEPDIPQISAYIGMPLFDELYRYMNEEYRALCKIEYSKDTWARGWNVKFRKAGKSLCVIYPREGYFVMLVVIGRKEKEKAELFMPHASEVMQRLYSDTKEGMGQRWLMTDIRADDALYQDLLKLIRIRRECR